MSSHTEHDAVTGTATTGHEWDGLKELNTPLPKWWLYTLYACIAWGVVWLALYPSIPYFVGHTKGLLGISTRTTVTQQVAAQAAQRAQLLDRIKDVPIEQVRRDPALMAVALTAGRTTFAENCQPCHGPGGAGNPGYPSLADDVWIWGGKLADIQRTITHGVRANDPETRGVQMPRFGADGLLKPEEIDQVSDYVMTLYGSPATERAAAGAKLFAANCAACHGAGGEGNRTVGAPPLKSAVHLYGNTRDVVRAQVVSPRLGVMPNWNARFDAQTIKALSLYVHALGGGE